MVRENVEVVRRIVEAWQGGDYQSALDLIDENVEFVATPDAAGGGRSHRGHDEMDKALAGWVEIWDDYEFELRNATGSGDEVLVEGWQRGRGRGSGIEVSEAIYMVWTVRNGKAVRQRMFRDRAEALQAAGLSEESA